ncbi:MAG: DUF3343 domain-containing protein [Gemmatimonadota bacterium]
MSRPIFIFETTHHALWAEEIAREQRIPHEIVPAPSESNARCDIAIETLPDSVAGMTDAFDGAGVEFRVFIAR